MAGRPRKAAVEELQSLEDCTRVMGELLIATAEEEAVLAEAALAVAKASQQFETRLNAARHAKRENEAALESYYYGHVTEIERDGQKFIQLVNGRMGRRDNPPKLVPLNKKWTWKTITIALREKFGLKYFHPTPSLRQIATRSKRS